MYKKAHSLEAVKQIKGNNSPNCSRWIAKSDGWSGFANPDQANGRFYFLQKP